MNGNHGMTFKPFKGSEQRETAVQEEANSTYSQIKKSRGASSKSPIKGDLSTEESSIPSVNASNVIGIPPHAALANFDDLPSQSGFNGPLRRLYAYRRVWDRWCSAIEETAAKFRSPIIEMARGLLTNPYHPTASSPWLDPDLKKIEGKLRDLLIEHNINRLGAGMGLGLGWDEELAFVVLSGIDRQATVRALAQVLQDLSSYFAAEKNDDAHLDAESIPSSDSQPISALQPHDCKDIQSAVKAMIAGFVEQYEDYLPPVQKQKAGHVLAPDDIERLKAWWRYVTSEEIDPYGKLKNRTLLVVIPEMEEVPLTVLNDLTMLLATELADLPFAVLTTSGVPAASYERLDRETRDYIRVKVLEVPCGPQFVERVLEEVIWGSTEYLMSEVASDQEMDVDTSSGDSDALLEVDVLMSSDFLFHVLDYLRCDPSLDAVLSFIQIKLMHHFSNPLTALLPSSLPAYNMEEIETESERPLSAKLLESFCPPGWESLSTAFEKQRTAFRTYSYQYRLFFRLFRFLEKFFIERSNVSFASERARKIDRDMKRISIKDLCDVEEQETAIEKLQMLLASLKKERLEELQLLLVPFLHKQALLTKGYITMKLKAEVQNAKDSTALAGIIINELDSWRLEPSKEIPLFFLWMLNEQDVSSPLLDPSPHYSMLAGILKAQELLTSDEVEAMLDEEDRGKKDDFMPLDITVLFERYLEAGRMINVYDLFSSFASVMDSQRRAAKRREEKAKGKGKEKGKEKEGKEKTVKRNEDERPQRRTTRSISLKEKSAAETHSKKRKVIKRGRGWEVEEDSTENDDDASEGDEDPASFSSPSKSPVKQKFKTRRKDDLDDGSVASPKKRKGGGLFGKETDSAQGTPRRSSRRLGTDAMDEDFDESPTRSRSPMKRIASSSPSKAQTPSRSRTKLPSPPVPPSESEKEDEDQKMEGSGEENGEESDKEESDTDPTQDPDIKARFLYAMHELDYLGFFRPTGRKADHLMKIRFEAN